MNEERLDEAMRAILPDLHQVFGERVFQTADVARHPDLRSAILCVLGRERWSPTAVGSLLVRIRNRPFGGKVLRAFRGRGDLRAFMVVPEGEWRDARW